MTYLEVHPKFKVKQYAIWMDRLYNIFGNSGFSNTVIYGLAAPWLLLLHILRVGEFGEEWV